MADYDSLPEDYIELGLCRDVYHCLPSQLDAEDWITIRRHIAMMAGEERVRKAKERVRK